MNDIIRYIDNDKDLNSTIVKNSLDRAVKKLKLIEDDWFANSEPITINRRHLINIIKPIGINTIRSSSRISSYDIKSGLPLPRINISPWLNSTIEPDFNLPNLY